MRIDVIPINELSDNLKKTWLKIQLSNPNLAGPCFHVELFVAVGKYWEGVYVAVISEGENVVGFLPFLKDCETHGAKRIPFCDFEAIISSSQQNWDMNVILKKIGVKSWDFNALANFENIKSRMGQYEIKDSPRIDLTRGFEEYIGSLKHGKLGDRELMRQRRVLERTNGPIRFVATCNDVKILHQLLQWKVARHSRDKEWAQLAAEVLEHIYYLNDPSFRGILSVLYSGDDILAINFSMRYQNIFKGVLITFNPIFSKYSAGMLLLYYLISEYKALEYSIFDFGPGEYQYKRDLANSALQVLRGNFKVDSFKERVKSVKWLHQKLRPFAEIGRKIKCNIKF